MTMSLFAARRSPPSARRPDLHRFTAMVVLISFFIGCTQSAPAAKPRVARDRGVGQAPVNSDEAALLEDVQRRTFHYFWGLADPNTHLVPDHAPTPSFSSFAAVRFGLTAYGIGAERGFVT